MSDVYTPVRYQQAANHQPDVRRTVSCPCRTDGPWRILGPDGYGYACARCGQPMTITDGWEADDAHR